MGKERVQNFHRSFRETYALFIVHLCTILLNDQTILNESYLKPADHDAVMSSHAIAGVRKVFTLWFWRVTLKVWPVKCNLFLILLVVGDIF